MSTIDLGSPPAAPTDLLDGLPRRVALSLPELSYLAAGAGGAPLPFELPADIDAGDVSKLDDRLGRSQGTTEAEAYAAALAGLPDPVLSLARRGLLLGGPDDGVLDPGLVGAVGLLATPTVALDLDVAAGGARARSWHRQSGGAVATLSTVDGLVFELAWFPTAAWSGELGRVAVVPEDVTLQDSAVPGVVDLPYELADAAGEALRAGRSDLVPVLVAQHRGSVVDERGAAYSDADTTGLLTALAAEARGRLRGLVANVSQEATTTVGVVSWVLLADGWRSLRPRTVDGLLRVEVRRVLADDLAGELAPVLAQVTT